MTGGFVVHAVFVLIEVLQLTGNGFSFLSGEVLHILVELLAAVDYIQRLAVYKKFRSLMDKWIELSIKQGMIQFFTPVAKAVRRSDSV